jgi:hypothetical protein
LLDGVFDGKFGLVFFFFNPGKLPLEVVEVIPLTIKLLPIVLLLILDSLHFSKKLLTKLSVLVGLIL